MEAPMKHIPIKLNGVKEGLYEIYADGSVWSNYKNDFLKPKEDKDGYLEVALSGGCRAKRRSIKIHTIVALHFIGEPPYNMTDPTVNHIDNDKHNNFYSNLEWTERANNSSIRTNKGQGNLNHFYNKKHSTETKEKLRQINLGKKYSDEINKKKGQKSPIVAIFEDRIEYFETTREFANKYDCKSAYAYATGRKGSPPHYFIAKQCWVYHLNEYENICDIL
jgi:predicted transposase YbfD/YdcC